MWTADALEEAIVFLGFDKDDASRRKLEALLANAVEGGGELPDVLRSRILATSGAPAETVDAALKDMAAPTLGAVRAAIAYRTERREKLEQLDDEEKEKEERDEQRIMDRLRSMGPCPQGFSWFRQGNGWRCGGGSHFVYDDDPILSDLQ